MTDVVFKPYILYNTCATRVKSMYVKSCLGKIIKPLEWVDHQRSSHGTQSRHCWLFLTHRLLWFGKNK